MRFAGLALHIAATREPSLHMELAATTGDPVGVLPVTLRARAHLDEWNSWADRRGKEHTHGWQSQGHIAVTT